MTSAGDEEGAQFLRVIRNNEETRSSPISGHPRPKCLVVVKVGSLAVFSHQSLVISLAIIHPHTTSPHQRTGRWEEA